MGASMAAYEPVRLGRGKSIHAAWPGATTPTCNPGALGGICRVDREINCRVCLSSIARSERRAAERDANR